MTSPVSRYAVGPVTDCTPVLRADAERNRQRLLAAAREVFAEYGLDVTLDDIARHAGVGVGTAYRRFPNKDALIDELLVEQVEAMSALAARQLEAEDPVAGLRGYLEDALALQVKDRGLKQVLFAHGRGQQRVEQARQKLGPAVVALVERAKASGDLRDDVLASDIALITVMLTVAVDFGRDYEPYLYRRYLDSLLRGLLCDAPAPEEPPLDMARFPEAMAKFKFAIAPRAPRPER